MLLIIVTDFHETGLKYKNQFYSTIYEIGLLLT